MNWPTLPGRVAFWGINPNRHDTSKDVQFAEEFALRFPLLRDQGNLVTARFGATRQLEVFLLDRTRQVRYHARIDDQYTPRSHRPHPLRDDLEIACDELLAAREVTIAEIPFPGCLIDRGQHDEHGDVTYSKDV